MKGAKGKDKGQFLVQEPGEGEGGVELRRVEALSDWPELEPLYERSFPPSERRALGPLIQSDSQGCSFWAGERQGRFVGFMVALHQKDLTHLIYFAVMEQERSKGVGAAMLKRFHALFSRHRLIADLELERPGASNNPQRHRRREFYLRAGYRPTAIRYSWHGDEYEILSKGGGLSFDEFLAFWKGVEGQLHLYDL